jgi:hypothetical protein
MINIPAKVAQKTKSFLETVTMRRKKLPGLN